MEPNVIIKPANRAEFRQWLEENHSTCREVWVRISRSKTPPPGVLPYQDSVMEALCFGWIDSTLKKDGEGNLIQRFTPRRKGSHWTELNIRRCRELEQLGLMTQAGLDAMPDNSQNI